MHLVRLLIIIPVLVFTSHLGAVQSQDDDQVIYCTPSYDNVRDNCYSTISYFRYDLDVLHSPDSFIMGQLIDYLTWYLIDFVDTLESQELYQMYEDVDWDIDEMMKIHHLNLDK